MWNSPSPFFSSSSHTIRNMRRHFCLVFQLTFFRESHCEHLLHSRPYTAPTVPSMPSFVLPPIPHLHTHPPLLETPGVLLGDTRCSSAPLQSDTPSPRQKKRHPALATDLFTKRPQAPPGSAELTRIGKSLKLEAPKLILYSTPLSQTPPWMSFLKVFPFCATPISLSLAKMSPQDVGGGEYMCLRRGSLGFPIPKLRLVGVWDN